MHHTRDALRKLLGRCIGDIPTKGTTPAARHVSQRDKATPDLQLDAVDGDAIKRAFLGCGHAGEERVDASDATSRIAQIDPSSECMRGLKKSKVNELLPRRLLTQIPRKHISSGSITFLAG